MDNILNKISRLFTSKFGTHLDIQWHSSKILQARARHWKTNFVYSRTNKRVSFPIFGPRHTLKGIATAYPVDNEDAVKFQEMANYLRLTLEEFVNLEEKARLIERKEEALENAHNLSSKIIRWPSKLKKAHPDIEPKIIAEKDPNDAIDNEDVGPLWIYGQEQKIMNQVAVACHEWVKNWASFNALEIPDLIWKENPDWTEFGRITLLLPNAEDWTPKQWKILEQNLKKIKNCGDAAPLLIVSSQKSAKELHPQLASDFKNFKVSNNLAAKVQAHFLLFHHRRNKPWEYQCDQWNQLFFLPFHRPSEQLH